MNLLMLKELLEVVERLATLVRVALVSLPANFVFDDVRELILQHLLDSGLFLNDCEAWVMSDLFLEIYRLLPICSLFLSKLSLL